MLPLRIQVFIDVLPIAKGGHKKTKLFWDHVPYQGEGSTPLLQKKFEKGNKIERV